MHGDVQAYLAVNLDTVVVILPLGGSELYGDIQAESWNEIAPLFRVFNGEEWRRRGYDVHLLIVSGRIDDLLQTSQHE